MCLESGSVGQRTLKDKDDILYLGLCLLKSYFNLIIKDKVCLKLFKYF